MRKFFQHSSEGAIIKIILKPNAKKNEIIGEFDDRIKIAIKAPPVDGKANAMLITFLAEKLHVAKKRLAILQGDSQRKKTVLVQGLSTANVEELFFSD